MLPILPLAASVLLGWGCGLLVNYLADVLPRERKLVHPACPACNMDYPLAKYIFWLPSCPNCRSKRSARVGLVFVAYLLAAYWLWISPAEKLPDWAVLVVLVYFGVVTVIDIEHRLILHPVSLVGAGYRLAESPHVVSSLNFERSNFCGLHQSNQPTK